jgi:hypothetical protein
MRYLLATSDNEMGETCPSPKGPTPAHNDRVTGIPILARFSQATPSLLYVDTTQSPSDGVGGWASVSLSL